MCIRDRSKTVRLLSGHILPRSESNFTYSHLDFKKCCRGETPDPCLQEQRTKGWGGEGIKGFLPQKEVQRERTGRGDRDGKGKGGGGASGRAGGSCSKVLRRDRRPWRFDDNKIVSNFIQAKTS